MDVSLVKCKSYDESEVKAALGEVLEPVGGLDWVKEGMTVIIKANLVSALSPDKAATTHPALLCALTDMFVSRGAEVIIGDSPGGVYNKPYVNMIYSASQMKLAEAHGAKLNQDFSQNTMKNPDGKVLKELTYTGYLDKADAIIDFCKLKAHGMMGMSNAAKNMFGVIPGTIKPEYHYKFPNYDDFADMIIDLDELFKPRLCITDAIIGMEGNGPTAGTPKALGFIAASRSPHKLDMVCAKILGLDADQIPTITAAQRRGLAPEKLSDIEVNAELSSFFVDDFRHSAVKTSLVFGGDGKRKVSALFSKAAGAVLQSKPKLDGKKCVGCAVCAGVCPAKAIEMVAKRPVIDREKCIKCFCCQEFCPKGAMQVHRTALARLISRI